MSQLSRRWRTGAGLMGAGLLAFTIATPAGRQAADPVARRQVLGEAALPAIDRGLAPFQVDGDPAERATRAALPADAVEARADVERGEVVVKFRTDDAATRTDTMRAVGGHGFRRPAGADFDLMAIPESADPEDVAAALAARPDVAYAQPRYRNHAMFRPNDTFYSLQWNFPAIDMERAWDINPGATSDIVVAVLDSGVAFKDVIVRYTGRAFRLDTNGPVYPALGQIDVPFAAASDLGDTSRFVAPRDFIWNDQLPLDLDGHGTHVAGTIGQATNNGAGAAGMAFNVRIMPVKVISDVWDVVFGNDVGGTDDIVAQGIRYAADNGANVINLSIGREAGGAAPVVEDAVRYAVSRGAFVAIAAGNDAAGQNRPNRIAEFATRIDGAVAVGAVGRGLNHAFYSTTGSYVEIAAPGGDSREAGSLRDGGILQQMVDQDLAATYTLAPALFRAPRFDVFQYYFVQGTSMATPHVSGFAALLRQQGITNPAAIEAAMKQFATDRGPAGADDQYGAGLINPRATLRGLGLAR
ncbi:MAG: S8 family serine peptidase [Vicinamibacterales bacterium]